MILYRIKNWAENYEISQTKKASFSKFVPLPNKLDGDGYTELIDHKNGAAHYGAWVTMVSIASKCNPKGSLVRDSGKPHDAASLSRITRIPASVFAEVLPRLVAIGWMTSEVVDQKDSCEEMGAEWERSGSVLPVHSNAVDYIQDNTEQDNTEQNIISSEMDSISEQVVMEFPCSGKVKVWGLTDKRLQTLQDLFPGIDATTEARKALAWCLDNPKRRKTANGMPTFLQNWMERNQNRGGGARAGPQTSDLFGGLREFVQGGGSS